MEFTSTRGNGIKVTSAQAIYQGLAKDGGLFVPTEIPTINLAELENWENMPYAKRAKQILKLFLSDYTEEEISYATDMAYGIDAFPEQVAPVGGIDDLYSVLELWHGKTSAFKDMALQILPYLLTIAVKKEGVKEKVLILVATSGDTGKAALEGFQDVSGTQIVVFYPLDGVSDIQKLQMNTQQGENVNVVAVKGNFDDAQTGVKNIFNDLQIAELLKQKGYIFSSANSINWGRLVPQIVYYISAYIDLLHKGVVKNGEKINFSVPTGNFGNILAAYYAKLMGLPINKLICASNANNVLTEFINTGVYNRNRQFYQTNSPSMDILISSNLERFLYIVNNGDASLVKKYMEELTAKGVYSIEPELLAQVQQELVAYSYNETQTCQKIKELYESNQYLLDTHTAVAYLAAEEYVQNTNDKSHTVVVSTANPFKFSEAVLSALGNSTGGLSAFEMNNLLAKVTGNEIPVKIKELENAVVRHTQVVDKKDMVQAVLNILEK